MPGSTLGVKLTPAVVRYPGSGLYKEDHVAILVSDLQRGGRREADRPTLPALAPSEHGRWPILCIEWDGWHLLGAATRVGPGGATLVLIWVICVYQWGWPRITAWPVWVLIPRQ